MAHGPDNGSQPIAYDQRLGTLIARALAPTPITANMVTFVSLLAAVAGAAGFALGPGLWSHIGAGLFVFARFIDHVDGELARAQGKTSRLGYYLDYWCGGISYASLFAGMGIGFAGDLGYWAITLGFIAAAVAMISLFLNMRLDRLHGLKEEEEAVGYPQFAGFELEDGIYLIAPITWMGWMMPFFIACTVGAAIYGVWTFAQVLRLRGR